MKRDTSDGLNVLYAGTLGRAQNLKNVIHAAKIAGDSGLKINLRIVGAGATKAELKRLASELGVSVSFEGRKSASELTNLYEWADTALVHLTDWEPLKKAVPSKTYELMEERIHITGVVSGEAAALISRLGAGSVVAPEDPRSLAELWDRLIDNPSLLEIGSEAQDWVRYERNAVVPPKILKLLESTVQ